MYIPKNVKNSSMLDLSTIIKESYNDILLSNYDTYVYSSIPINIYSIKVKNSKKLSIDLTNVTFSRSLNDYESSILVCDDSSYINIFNSNDTQATPIDTTLEKKKSNYIYVKGSHCIISKNSIVDRFIPVTLEGENNFLTDTKIHNTYGDAIRILSSNNTVTLCEVYNSYSYYPYEEFHCDLLQIFPKYKSVDQYLDNIVIKFNRFFSTNSNVQGVLHSDGILRNSIISNNFVSVKSPIGIWTDVTQNSQVTSNTIYGLEGTISIGMDKKTTTEVSSNNLVEHNIVKS